MSIMIYLFIILCFVFLIAFVAGGIIAVIKGIKQDLLKKGE